MEIGDTVMITFASWQIQANGAAATPAASALRTE